MIVIAVALVFMTILFIYFTSKDKMTIYSMKLKNIEEKINSTLIKRKELLKDSEVKIKELLNTNKTIYENFSELSNSSNDMIKFDKKLAIYTNEFNLIKDKYKKLRNNEDFQKIAFKINETDDLLKAYKEYYNKYAESYNKQLKSFPFVIINIFKRKKKKNYFDSNYEEEKL